MRVGQCFLILVVGLLVSLSTRAESLTVIYDAGNTLSIDRYARKTPPPERAVSLDHIKRSLLSTPSTLPVSFPVTTPTMQPGNVKSTAFSLPQLQIPLFLIGSDDLSRQWLQQRVNELRQLGAVGLLVDVDSQETWETMARLASGLQLIPASGTAITQTLGLRYYPVLISNSGWEQ